MTRPGIIGPVLPVSAKGHCGFITRWAVDICYAPASEHILFGGTADRSKMFVCPEHAARAIALFNSPDGHTVTAECVHPDAEWQDSSPSGPGFCFVPAEDVELIEGVRELTATRG